MRKLGGAEERLETEPLFEADDAVLQLEVVHSAFRGQDQQSDREDDPPDDDVGVRGPVTCGDADSEEDVEDEDGKDEEVDPGIETMVIFEILFG